MIFSKEQIFSDDQALTTSAVSTNIIDLGATGTVYGAPAALTRDIGKGELIQVMIQLTADAGGTTPTISATLEVDDNDAFSSAKDAAQSVTLTSGVAGARLSINYIPQGTDERYMRLSYTTGGTSPTHTVTAGIVHGAQTNG